LLATIAAGISGRLTAPVIRIGGQFGGASH